MGPDGFDTPSCFWQSGRARCPAAGEIVLRSMLRLQLSTVAATPKVYRPKKLSGKRTAAGQALWREAGPFTESARRRKQVSTVRRLAECLRHHGQRGLPTNLLRPARLQFVRPRSLP